MIQVFVIDTEWNKQIDIQKCVDINFERPYLGVFRPLLACSCCNCICLVPSPSSCDQVKPFLLSLFSISGFLSYIGWGPRPQRPPPSKQYCVVLCYLHCFLLYCYINSLLYYCTKLYYIMFYYIISYYDIVCLIFQISSSAQASGGAPQDSSIIMITQTIDITSNINNNHNICIGMCIYIYIYTHMIHNHNDKHDSHNNHNRPRAGRRRTRGRGTCYHYRYCTYIYIYSLLIYIYIYIYIHLIHTYV